MLQSLRILRVPSWTSRPVVNIRWFSDDEKFEKKEKSKSEKPKEKKIQSKEARERLSALLANMPTESVNSEVKVTTASKKKPDPKPEVDEKKDPKIITEKIAKKLGGDVQETEAVLLSKLLGIKDLKSSGSMADLISAMQVDREQEKPRAPRKERDQRRNEDGDEEEFTSRAENVRRSMGPGRDRPRRTETARYSGVVDLFGAERLGIFTEASDSKDPLETWSKLEQRELKLAITHPPNNYFEKMVQWTDKGILWKFPIDNEQGWDETEKNADFSEHVLLEMFLEGWCPTSGPVRHFMELVCVGLSKNHFLTAKEKREHIFWYRDYFDEKKDLLGDLMTMGRTEQSKLDA